METTSISSPIDKEPEKPHTVLQRLLINRNYALLWAALGTSRFGNVIFDISIVLWVATTLAKGAPWAAFAVGSLAFLPKVVSFFVAIVAGVFVDRWNKKRTLLFMDGFRAVLVFLLVFVTGIVPLPFTAGSDTAALFQLACLLFVVALMSVCNPFVNGGLVAFLYEILEDEDFSRAFGRTQLVNNVITITAPALAAGLFFVVGIQAAIIIDALTFAVSFGCVIWIRPTIPTPVDEAAEKPATEKRSFIEDFLSGLRFMTGNTVLVAMGIATVLTTLGVGALTILSIFFVTNNLHSPPASYPFLDVAFGVGAIVGALAGPPLRAKIGLLKVFWMPTLATGFLVLIFSRLTNIYAGCVLMFLIGGSQAILFVAVGPLAMKVTPRALIGRINAVMGQLNMLATAVSVTISAYLIATLLHNRHLQLPGLNLGPVDAVFTAAGILMITSAICSMVTLNRYAATEEQGQTEQERAAPDTSYIRKRQLLISCAGFVLAIIVILPVALAPPIYQPTAPLQHFQGQPATGQTIDGLKCEPTVGAKTKMNIHLSIYVNNKAVAIPAGIGIVAPPRSGIATLASNGKLNCLYPLHVYENDNIIHAELFDNRTYNLGQFFDIWGQPLDQTHILGYQASQNQGLVFSFFDEKGDQHDYTHDPRTIPLAEHQTIVILLNSPGVHPMPFTDWNGI
ncbi:MAG: MFS transporter [Ktedonobacteraceae bacterium]|nr:MFS transporter [Ktedonobacteraceae bacterium]